MPACYGKRVNAFFEPLSILTVEWGEEMSI